MNEPWIILVVLFLFSTVILFWLFYKEKQKSKNLERKIEKFKKEKQTHQTKLERLKKYETIADVNDTAKKMVQKAKATLARANEEARARLNKAQQQINKAKLIAERINQKAHHEYQQKVSEAEEAVNTTLKEARAKAKEIKDSAEQKLRTADEIAAKLEADAREKAENIAGEAWTAKENAEQYTATVTAMKNIIKGYGDEYLIPNSTVLDELAAEFDHKEAGQELAKQNTIIKNMIKNGESADCDYAEPNRRSTAIDFVLDAFNGKVETIIAKVKHDNYGKLLQELEDAFRIVNHNGNAFRNARITPRFYDARVQQLKLAVAVQELKRLDLEEQRRLKEEIREEEKAKRDFEKAKKEAEKEEKMLQKALKEAEAKLASAVAEERSLYQEKLEKLREQLQEAEAKGQRALSMAQQTKRGHVYVISNIGSFGENVFKIGLTRRLDPLDRVKELGDASVPFSFDVHAMIYSDDAPKLEREMHEFFQKYQVNRVNPKKEFFRIPLTEIKAKANELGLDAHWTMRAEALEFRESLQLIKKNGTQSEINPMLTSENMGEDSSVGQPLH